MGYYRKKYRLRFSIRVRVFFDRLFLHPYSVFKHTWKQIAVLGTMIAFGALVFSYFQHLDPLSALLASVSTISTIGLYAPPITSIPNIEKVLLIGIILTSVGSAASLVQGVMNSVVKSDLWEDELQKDKIKYMKNHTIILGYTHIGRYVAERLLSTNKDFCIITRKKENIDELKKLGIPYIISDLTSPIDALIEANVQNARAIILTLESDEQNMLFALTAMHLNPNIRTIAVNNSEQAYESLKKAGIEFVIPIYRIVGAMLASSVITESVVGVITDSAFKLSGMQIVEVSVKQCSKINGMKVKELPFDYFMLMREGRPIKYLTAEEELKPGDRIIAIVNFSDLPKVERFLECSR